MAVSQEAFLCRVFEGYREIERQTIEALGEEEAHVFVNLWNDSFEIQNAIDGAYPQEERIRSLVAVRLWEFSRELLNLQVLFLCGNYSLLRGRLRFILEMIFRAFHADKYERNLSHGPDGQGPSLDDKSAWLERLEENRGLSWGNLMEPTLRMVLPVQQIMEELKHLRSSHTFSP
jgi:hypothetical protein